MLILGLTGHPASGKDTVAEYLVSLGFDHFSTGDTIRAEMKREGLHTDRGSVRDFAAKKRKEHGLEYPIPKIIDKINKNTVVSGLRNVGEVKALEKAFGKEFTLVAVEAPVEVRYKRVLGRKRTGDEINFEQFKAEEDLERNRKGHAQEVDNVIAMADKVILNDGTKRELVDKIKKLIK
ncbi:MAG TPA: AAA family ATPase [Candidatus Paceibacterota bacterium]